jgi:phosphonate transport system substrate-binding protein
MLQWLIVLTLLLSLGCTENKRALEPVYFTSPVGHSSVLRFAVHPLHNPDRLNAVFGPLVTYINQKYPGLNIQLEASVNYAAFEEKLKKREVEFALPNPYQTLMAVKYGYRVFAKMGDDHNFRGIILVRKDSGINKVFDLKGKTISYPAPTALAATMMPQYFLFKQGLDVLKETKSIYVGSQESSIMNVYLKNSQAACTWPPPWLAFKQNNPGKAKELEIKWETDQLPNNGLVVRDDVPTEILEKVKEAILSLQNTEQGQKNLGGIGLSKFESATGETFAPVKKFLEQFTMELRSPEREK